MDTARATEPTLIDLEQQAISVRSAMAEIAIADQSTYNLAVEKRTAAVTWLKGAETFFDPSIADAHALHKKLLAQKKTVCEPVEMTIRTINRELLRFDEEQARIRREEQRRLEDESRRKAEEERLAQAEQMQAEGADEEVIDAVLEAPVQVTEMVIARPTYEKSKEVIYRDNYSGECFDLLALVKAIAKDKSLIGLVQVNQTALNQMAKALKETMSIPGCRPVNNKVVATGRG
jgi:hypothetical protein